MSLISYKLGQQSIILRVKILNSSVATGAGLTGLTYSSSGLIISTIADNEASPAVYTVAASHVQDITTLGTFAAPSASCCRFKEVDATNHKGVYEIQIADARYAVSNAKSLLVSISGAANLAETDAVIPLSTVDPYDGVRGGMTSLPNAVAEATGGLYTRGTGAGQINQPANGQIDANMVKVGGTTQTARDLGLALPAVAAGGKGGLPITDASTGLILTGYGGGTITLNSYLTGLLTTAIGAEGATGRLAANFLAFLNAAAQNLTGASSNQTGDLYAFLAAMIEASGGHNRWKATALEESPTGGAATAQEVWQYTTRTLTSPPPTANTIADALLDRANGIEVNATLRQTLRLMAAVLAGKVSGAGSGTESFLGLDGATPRVVVTTDAAGNRTNVVYTP